VRARGAHVIGGTLRVRPTAKGAAPPPASGGDAPVGGRVDEGEVGDPRCSAPHRSTVRSRRWTPA